MKIGILTFHRAHNYGAVLQCYALQEVLKGMGHEVEVIDYRQPWIEGFYSLFYYKTFCRQYPGIIEKLRYIKNINWRRNIVNKKAAIFKPFVENYLNCSKPCKNIPQTYERYIVGSDQLWAPNCLGNEFDAVYLGKFPHSQKSKVIGYAISTNVEALKRLDKEYTLRSVISEFNKISFREEELCNYVNSKTDLNLQPTLDPTLLTTPNMWNDLINTEWATRRYVVIYQIRTSPESTNYLYSIAEKYVCNNEGCKIIDLSDMTYSVNDFVSIIKYADYVFTTSFHATVFSIIFQRNFCAITLNDGHDGRYVNLLNELELTQCIHSLNEQIDKFYDVINYDTANRKLELLRQKSINFLRTSI